MRATGRCRMRRPEPGMDDRPFLGRQAVRGGRLTTYQLRTRYRAVYRNVYVPNDATPTAASRARAASLWAGGDAVLAGISAAAVLGTEWLDGGEPAELIRSDRHCPAGVVVRSWHLSPDELCFIGGMRATTPARTAFDVGRMLPQNRAVPIMDALMKATNVKPADVLMVADARPGCRGVQCLRAAVELADKGAESPQESRVRLLLVKAGLPKPRLRSSSGTVMVRYIYSSTWGGASGRWPWSTTVYSTGRTGVSDRGTSTGLQCSTQWDGSSSGSALKCSRGRTSSSSG